MTKYLQWRPEAVDGNGLAPISAEVVSFGAPPDCPNQISVADDAGITGMAIDTLNVVLVPNPNRPPVVETALQYGTTQPVTDVDMTAEYQTIIGGGGFDYFTANFVKIA